MGFTVPVALPDALPEPSARNTQPETESASIFSPSLSLNLLLPPESLISPGSTTSEGQRLEYWAAVPSWHDYLWFMGWVLG